MIPASCTTLSERAISLRKAMRLVGGQRILQARLEVAAGEILHRQVFDTLVDAVVEQVDDRRMIERGDRLELALEHDRALARCRSDRRRNVCAC